jgi:Tfp pilus assembly protein PilV
MLRDGMMNKMNELLQNVMRALRPKLHRRTLGFTLIEIILATSIITTFLVSISMYYKKILDVSHDTTRHIQSGFLLEEGVEVVKLLRDTSWSTRIATLSTTTTYYLYWNNGTWTSTTTKQVVENVFTRSFTVADVTRDVSDNIASSGTYDPSSKKVMFAVTWPRKGSRATTTESAETYIMNLFNN